MTQTDTTVEFTREEIIEQLDEAARERGLSICAMLTSFRNGSLANPAEVLDVLALADILPEDDPLRCGR